MNPVSLPDAKQLFSRVGRGILGVRKVETVICVPFIYLEPLRGISKKISLGAQDAFWKDLGAFTGEISSEMLYNLGVRYVILGHSERRALGEGNLSVNKKIKAVLGAGLFPVLCVGESTRDDTHGYFNLVKSQLEECLVGVSKNLAGRLIVAYEPIWAISSTENRRDATAEDSREMAVFIRKVLTDRFGAEASFVRVIYGGSANEKDAAEFLQNGGVDGLLPGRASLDAEKFISIVKTAERLCS